jgi:hypothetical protein
MVKSFSAMGILAGVCLMAACTKRQNYGSTAVEQASSGWWVTATSSVNGVLAIPPADADNHLFFTTYNASANTRDSLWVDDLGYIGGVYDVKALLGIDPGTFTLKSGGTVNLYQSGNDVQWAAGKIFIKGGRSRTGVVTDSLFVQMLFTGNPGDTLTIAGVARTGFDGDDWPDPGYTPTP